MQEIVLFIVLSAIAVFLYHKYIMWRVGYVKRVLDKMMEEAKDRALVYAEILADDEDIDTDIFFHAFNTDDKVNALYDKMIYSFRFRWKLNPDNEVE